MKTKKARLDPANDGKCIGPETTPEAYELRDLPRDKSDCQVCGNELNGKTRCDFCGMRHKYL